jgi:hypothetical protein
LQKHPDASKLFFQSASEKIMTTPNELTIAHSIRQTWSAPGVCATFEMATVTRQWLQYGDGRINARYPRHVHPGALVAIMGGELHAWRAGLYITVGALPSDIGVVACWINSYFHWVLGCPAEATLSVVVANFAVAAAAAP